MTAEAWIAIANLILALAAVAASVAAFLGLRTWKNQSIWNADNELSRRILIALYRYRDSLYLVRHPAMSHSEMKLSDETNNDLSDDEIRRQGIIQAYANRWERHSASSRELDALMLESDAVWGSDLSELRIPLRELEHELFAYISLHLDAHFRGDTELAREYRVILNSKRDILYDRMKEEDEYRKSFVSCMTPMESYLKTKLGHAK